VYTAPRRQASYSALMPVLPVATAQSNHAEAPDPPSKSPAGILWRAAGAAGLVALFLSLSIQRIWNVDTWWQLATGRWILEHHRVPQVDQFSFTAAGQPWIELRWIFCVLAALGYANGGAGLLTLGQVGILLVTFGLIIASHRRAALTPMGMSLVGLGIAAGANRFVVRPELLTYFYYALFLTILRVHLLRKSRFIWALPVLQILWVNSHTLFVFGPIVAWTFAIAIWLANTMSRVLGWNRPTETQSPHWPLFIVAGLTTLACLVNPYGWDGARFPLTLYFEIRHSGLRFLINEFQSPLSSVIWTADLWAALGLTIAVTVLCLLNWRAADLANWALFAMHVGLAAVSVRNVGLLSIVALWTGLQQLESFGNVHPRYALRRSLQPAAYGLLFVSCLLASWYVWSGRLAGPDSVRIFGVGVVEITRPVGAVNFLAQHPELRGNLFNDLADGSYLAGRTDVPSGVFIDPRLEVYGERFIEQALTMSLALFDRWLDEFKINTAMLHTQSAPELATHLFDSDQWALVYLDARNVIFVRQIPQHAALIAAARIDPITLTIHDSVIRDDVPTGLRRALGGIAHPWNSRGLADAFLALRAADNAGRALQQVLGLRPSDRLARLQLAQVRMVQGKPEAAQQLVAGLRLSPQEELEGELLRANLLLGGRRFEEAVQVLTNAARESPFNGLVITQLANALFRAGQFEQAVREYKRLTAARPERTDFWLRLGDCHRELGQNAQAVAAHQRVLSINPSSTVAKERLREIASQDLPATQPTSVPNG
jgi:tetratricopeptide (TPR) repeat protein